MTELLLQVEYDEIGRVKSMNVKDETPAVTHEDQTEEFLAHFGIKGMKWGHRNSESKAREARDGGDDGDAKPGVVDRVKAKASAKAKSAAEYAKTPQGQTDIRNAALVTAAGTAFVAKHHEVIMGTAKIAVIAAKAGVIYQKNKQGAKFAGKMIAGTGSHLAYAAIKRGVPVITNLR